MTTSNVTTAELIVLIRSLQNDHDHGFISPEGVENFTKPFGFTGKTYIARANPSHPKGLALTGGAGVAEGQDADEVAAQICRHLGISYTPKYGRGARLRSACAAILAHLEAQLASELEGKETA